jgi:hypothetical protein
MGIVERLKNVPLNYLEERTVRQQPLQPMMDPVEAQ